MILRVVCTLNSTEHPLKFSRSMSSLFFQVQITIGGGGGGGGGGFGVQKYKVSLYTPKTGNGKTSEKFPEQASCLINKTHSGDRVYAYYYYYV